MQLDSVSLSKPVDRFDALLNVWKYPLMAFIICFFVRLPTLFHGIDLSDMGFALTNQMVVKKMGLAAFKLNPVCFFSDYLASFWNSFTEPLGYIGVRLGNAFLYSICSMIVTKTMQNYIRNKWLLTLSVILASLVTFQPHITCQSFPFLGYYAIPMFFSLLCICQNLSFIQKPTMSKSIVLSCLLFFLFITRFTMIPMVILPLISLPLIEKPHRSKALLSFGAALLLILLLISYYNQFFDKGVFQYIGHQRDAINFGFKWILPYYFKQLKYSFLWTCFGALLTFFCYKVNKKLVLLPTIAISILLFTARYVPRDLLFGRKSFARTYNKLFWRPDEFHALGLVVGFGIIFFIIWFLVRLAKSKKVSFKVKKEVFFLFASSLVFCVSIGFGSGGGLSMMGYGAWLLFPIAYFLAEQFPSHVPSLSISMAICAAFIATYMALNPFRDEYNLGTKLSSIKTPKLKGTITSIQKQRALDELFSEISIHVNKGDKIFAYHSIPMVYWGSDTFPVTSHCWPWLLGIEYIRKELTDHFSMETPKIIVKAKFNSSESKWVIKEEAWYKEGIVEMDKCVQKYFNPKLIWTNNLFEIYKPNQSGDQ